MGGKIIRIDLFVVLTIDYLLTVKLNCLSFQYIILCLIRYLIIYNYYILHSKTVQQNILYLSKVLEFVLVCSQCGKKAVFHQRNSGRYLCRMHFVKDIERRVRYSINKYNMIETNDKVAISLSGGKDSVVLTHILKKMYGKREDLEFCAITIDEGIEGYRPPTVEIARKLTSELGIEHHVVSFKDEIGETLDWMVEKGECVGGKKPCTYCGVFRKYLLNKTARDLGATKLATGHNLDDETQTIMLNFLQSDITRLARLVPQRKQKDLIMRIKPLRLIYEKEVVIYATLFNLLMDMDECPYSHFPVRAVVRDFLYEFENKYPGRKFSVMKSFENLIPALTKMFPQIELNSCKICKEPTPGEICQACALRKELGLLR